MGPLTRRIQRRRAQVQVQSIMRKAKRDAQLMRAVVEDKTDGGLLAHAAFEAEAARG